MKKLDFRQKKPYLRLLIEFMIAIALAVIIELGFNYHSLTGGYAPVDMTQNAVSEDGKLICRETMEKPVYIKKLIVQGEFLKKFTYTVNATVVNDFGVEEQLEITDRAYAGFEAAFTDIGQRVKELEVVFSRPGRMNLKEISYTNEVQFNKYRMLLFALVCFLAQLILFERKIVLEKLEIVYLVFALGFGSLMIVSAVPCATTWDEEVHYRLVSLMNFNQDIEYNQAVETNFERLTISVNTVEELSMLKAYMDQQALIINETQPGIGLGHKEYITYLPMILTYHLGGLLKLPYTYQYALGRLGNLLFCAALNFLAIYLAKRKKILITVVASMPTVLFQASMYTYDGIIFSCLTLGFVLCMNAAEEKNRKGNIGKIAAIFVLFAVASLAKPTYAPAFLLLFPMLIPNGKKAKGTARGNYRKWIAVGIIIVVCVLILVLCAIPLLTNMMNGNMSYGGDMRGGETGVIGQLTSILQHPVAFLKMLIHELFTMDNFRNFGDESKNRFLVSNLMFLNLYVLGILKDAWSLILLPLLVLLFLAEPQGETQLPGNIKKIRIENGIVLISTVLLIWLAMYLTFTPIGNDGVEGVQARYFLPLFLPTAYTVWNDKVIVRIPRLRYYQIALGATLLLVSQCMFQCLIGARLA